MGKTQDEKIAVLSAATLSGNGGLESITENLSIRAKRVLVNLGVKDEVSLLRITRDDLKMVWSCGKKTIAEIEVLQSKLRPKNEQEIIKAQRNTLDFANAPKEVFHAVQSILGVRGLHVMEDLNVDNLGAFMMLQKGHLLKCRNCGRKTADEIIRIQTGIIDFAHDSLQNYSKFQPEQLLAAPCLFNNKSDQNESNTVEGVFVDADNPAPWLADWVRSLSRSEKQAHAFMLRKGMLGFTPMTLELVGEKVGGVSRERARQMEVALEKRASTPLQQHRLRPLIDLIATKVKLNGGMIGLNELTKDVLSKGENGKQLMFATELLSFFSTLKVWRDAGLKLRKDGLVSHEDSRSIIHQLVKIIEDVASANADERHADELWSIDRKTLKEALQKNFATKYGRSQLVNISDALLDTILKQCRKRLKAHKDRVYSISLWLLRFGNITQMMDTVLLQMGKPSHFTEVAKYMHIWRTGFSERNAHAALDRSKNTLLWDRGTFVHKDNVVIPFSLIHDIESWLLNVLKDDIPFVSVNGAFSHFRTRCERAGFPSEVALYTCLRKPAHPDLMYPRLPFVYLKKGFTQRIPVPIALEGFLRDAGGPVSPRDLKEFGIGKLFLKDFQFSQVSQRIANVIRTADWGYLHIENADLDYEFIELLIQYTKEVLSKEEHCSIAKIYHDKKVTCRSAGVDSSVMFYSVLQYFAEELFSLNGYPHIARPSIGKKMGRYSIKRRVLDFLRDAGKPCPYEILEKRFVEQLGYKEHQVYSVGLENEVCLYHSGCVIHREVLGWDDVKQRDLERLALHIYEDAAQAGIVFGRVSHLVESIELPKLPVDLYWSRVLIGDLLVKGGRFLVLGNSREAFLPKKNDQGIQTFEALVAILLNRDWSGAANLAAFESALRETGIIKRHISQTMLGSGQIVTIKNGEIFLKELLCDAKRS